MQVIDCARAAGVTADTVRHYARLGLIKAESRTEGGYQNFSQQTVARVRFIRTAVALGFKLGDIAELLQMSDRGHLPCPKAREILAERLPVKEREVEEQLELLGRMKNALLAWQHMPDGVPNGTQVCGLIEGVVQSKPVSSGRRRTGPATAAD